VTFRCEDKDCPSYGKPLTDDFVCQHSEALEEQRIKWSGSYYAVTRGGRKHAVCPICSREWLTGRPGGGQVISGVKRHVQACIRKHADEMPEFLKAL